MADAERTGAGTSRSARADAGQSRSAARARAIRRRARSHSPAARWNASVGGFWTVVDRRDRERHDSVHADRSSGSAATPAAAEAHGLELDAEAGRGRPRLRVVGRARGRAVPRFARAGARRASGCRRCRARRSPRAATCGSATGSRPPRSTAGSRRSSTTTATCSNWRQRHQFDVRLFGHDPLDSRWQVTVENAADCPHRSGEDAARHAGARTGRTSGNYVAKVIRGVG